MELAQGLNPGIYFLLQPKLKLKSQNKALKASSSFEGKHIEVFLKN
jgi:hypothetical protein